MSFAVLPQSRNNFSEEKEAPYPISIPFFRVKNCNKTTIAPPACRGHTIQTTK